MARLFEWIRRPLVGLMLLSLGVVAGCREQAQISTYTVPRIEGQGSGKQRMLAAMVPSGNQAWFFKLQGPDEAVSAEVENFRRLVSSVKFDRGEPQWELPKRWTRLRGSGMRFATLEIETPETPDKPLNATVIRLPMEADTPEYRLSNVNRWRGQLGLDRITLDQLQDEVQELELAEAEHSAVMVNLVGSPLAPSSPEPGGEPPMGPFAGGPAAGGGPAPFAGGGPSAAADKGQQAILGVIAIREGKSWFVKYSGDAELGLQQEAAFKKFVSSIRFVDGNPPLTFEAPEGWTAGAASGFRKAAFTLASDDLKGEVTVIDLAAAGGELLPNVNRWRGQVGLGPTTDGDLQNELEEISLDDVRGSYIKIVGPEPTGADNGN